MAGIYGVLIKKNQSSNIYKRFYNFNKKSSLFNEVAHKNIRIGRSVLDKFNNDRFFYENEGYIICFEGINYSKIRTPEDFLKEYNKEGINFIKKLKGVFCGLIYIKNDDKIFVFNDQLASKNIFYFYDKNIGFIFSSEMHVLSDVLKENNIKKDINYDAIYSLALYGQLFGKDTPLKQVDRLDYATIIEFSNISNSFSTLKYFKLKKEEKKIGLSSAINDIDDLMQNAISNEWGKDLEYNYKSHMSLISGGMDARVNSLIASEIGFKNIHSYTYGEASSSDVKIAQKIAQNFFHSHLSNSYGKGEYLYDDIFEKYIKPSDGLVIFAPVATMLHSLNKINFLNYGLLHSGQIGDAVFGSLLKPNFKIQNNKDKIGLTGFIKDKTMIDKISNLDANLNKYYNTDYELFAYEQRVINGALTGDRVSSNLVDHVSPFYNIELINYMLSLPNSFKLNQEIYFKWLEKRYPHILSYDWEKTGMKPNSVIKRKYGGLYKKYTNGAKKMFALNYDSMNPISLWAKKNPKILLGLNLIYENEIDRLECQDLKNDLKNIYSNDIFEYRNRFSVITALLSLKLHFYNDDN